MPQSHCNRHPLRPLRRLVCLGLAFAALLGAAAPACAQDNAKASTRSDDVQDLRYRVKAVRGYSTADDPETGEPTLMIHLKEITVYPPLKFKNKKEEDFYWKTVRDVRKTLPYAKVICETMIETYEYLETLPTQKERDAHLKRMEGAIFEQYKPALKKFTKGQAQMLCKLINRETNSSGYDILKAFLGSFRATFWQTFGKLFGVNIKTDYKPTKDKKDAIIERVATLVEQGAL